MASRRTKIFWAICAALLAFIFTLATTSGVVYYRQVIASRIHPIFAVDSPGSPYDVGQLVSSPNLLSLGIGFSDFDPDKGMKLQVSFDPMNNLTNQVNQNGEPTSFICFSYQSTDLLFKPDEEMNTETITLPFTGDINLFPFDKWDGTLTVNAHYGADNESCTNPLPLMPSVLGATQNFIVTASASAVLNADSSKDYSQVVINFSARRSKIHVCFSVLMFIVSWGLTFNLTYICCWTWKGGKRIELGIIAMTAAFLYALPRVRETQPSIPKMGIIEDLVGYCWQVLLISCCLVSNMVNFILKKERKKAIQAVRKGMLEDGMVKERIF